MATSSSAGGSGRCPAPKGAGPHPPGARSTGRQQPEWSWRSGAPETPVDDVLDLAGDHPGAGLERLLHHAEEHLPATLDGGGELLGALDLLPGLDQPGHAFFPLLNADHVSDCETHQRHHGCPPGVVVVGQLSCRATTLTRTRTSGWTLSIRILGGWTPKSRMSNVCSPSMTSECSSGAEIVTSPSTCRVTPWNVRSPRTR